MRFKPGEQAIIDLLERNTFHDGHGYVGLRPAVIRDETGLHEDYRRYLTSLERRGEIQGVVRGAVLMFVRVKEPDTFRCWGGPLDGKWVGKETPYVDVPGDESERTYDPDRLLDPIASEWSRDFYRMAKFGMVARDGERYSWRIWVHPSVTNKEIEDKLNAILTAFRSIGWIW